MVCQRQLQNRLQFRRLTFCARFDLKIDVHGMFDCVIVYSLKCIFRLTLLSCFPQNALARKQYKKAQLSLTKPRDVKVCQKLLQFDVLTTLSLTILAYLHSFSCCCVRNLRNPAKFTKIQTYGVQGHPRSSILVSMESPYVTSY